MEEVTQDEVSLEEATGFDVESEVAAARKEDDGIVVHIHSVKGTPLYFNKNGAVAPVTITVAGSHSERMRRAEAAIRRRKLKPKQFTGQVIYDDNIEKTAACTLAWEGFVSSRRPGQEANIVVKMTEDNAKQLYKRCPWVLEQVLLAMNDHESFFETESTTQSTTSDM